jgi:autotransporter strand-loop-strand O-heptosyltransferase
MFRYNLVQIDGLYFELVETPKNKEYVVRFVENIDGVKYLLYECTMTKGMWAKADRTYLSNYYIEIWEKDSLRENISFINHLKGRRVFVCIDSNSLGDTLAWMPYLVDFKEKYGCFVIVSTFKNDMFESVYPELTFAGRGEVVNNIHAQYKIGWFYDRKKEPTHPATIPLQKSCTNILNLEYVEKRPRLNFTPKERPIEGKYVCISVHSTAQLKYWDYWQDVINYLNSNGYLVVEVSKEEVNFENIIKLKDTSMDNTMNYIHHCEFVIGLSSGISWLAWSLKKKVIMIANFTQKSHEFQEDCIRITNDLVCNSCWNNPKYKFNKGDWYWCPEHEHTPNAFECHKSIKAQSVIDEINRLIEIPREVVD